MAMDKSTLIRIIAGVLAVVVPPSLFVVTFDPALLGIVETFKNFFND
jgi:hypothetical protein